MGMTPMSLSIQSATLQTIDYSIGENVTDENCRSLIRISMELLAKGVPNMKTLYERRPSSAQGARRKV